MSRIEIELDRFPTPSREKFEHYICESRPFIIENALEGWGARNWTPDYLMQKIGDRVVPLRQNEPSHVATKEWLGTTKERPFSDFVREWQTSQHASHYLASLPIKKHFPELENDIIPPCYAQEQKKSGNLWIGMAGQVTAVHHDWSGGDPGMDGLHVVVQGRKLFKLFDPLTNAKCFKRKQEWGHFHQALVDIEAVEEEQKDIFPEYFLNAKFFEIELRAGEALFIPKLWWHHVRTLENSIAVNFWFQHIGSEKLKLTKFWPHMEEYLLAVENLHNTTPPKMVTVLQFLGVKTTEEEAVEYIRNPHKLMVLPKFIASFGNGARSPFVAGKEADEFAAAIEEKVRAWIFGRAKCVSHNTLQP